MKNTILSKEVDKVVERLGQKLISKIWVPDSKIFVTAITPASSFLEVFENTALLYTDMDMV